MLHFSIGVTVINKATNRIEEQAIELRFYSQANEITVQELSSLEVYSHNLPLWAKVALGLKAIEKIDPLDIEPNLYRKNWTLQQIAEYANILIDVLHIFAADENTIAHLRNLQKKAINDYADVAELEKIVVAVYNGIYSYEASEREYFEHKGREFIIPYNAEIIGKALTWGEASEALQSDYMTNKPNEEGKFIKELALNNSLTIVSALCREVATNDDGTFTEIKPPTKGEEWEQYLVERKAFFSNLPADVVMDIGFFLTNSFIRSEVTISTALLLSNPKYKEMLKENLCNL